MNRIQNKDHGIGTEESKRKEISETMDMKD